LTRVIVLAPDDAAAFITGAALPQGDLTRSGHRRLPQSSIDRRAPSDASEFLRVGTIFRGLA
jgi:hypothetical protein